MKGEFYKMDFRAWNTGTVDLTLEQEAAYLRLCHAMYDAQGPIPDSIRLLQGIFRCGNVKASALVQQLIKADKIRRTSEGKLTNRRVETELAGRERLSEVRRLAGEGGRAHRRIGSGNPSEPRVIGECSPSDPEVTAECPTSDPSVIGAKSLTDNGAIGANVLAPGSRGEKIREEKTPVVPKGTKPDRFDEFRTAYPPRNTRFPTTLARKRWDESMKRGADPEKIIAGAKSYGAEQAQNRNAGTPYVKTADVWLRNQLWNDYQPELGAGSAPTDPVAYLATLSTDDWRGHLRRWKTTGGQWTLAQRTPPPNDPRTLVPASVLAEIGIHHPSQRPTLALMTGTGR